MQAKMSSTRFEARMWRDCFKPATRRTFKRLNTRRDRYAEAAAIQAGLAEYELGQIHVEPKISRPVQLPSLGYTVLVTGKAGNGHKDMAMVVAGHSGLQIVVTGYCQDTVIGALQAALGYDKPLGRLRDRVTGMIVINETGRVDFLSTTDFRPQPHHHTEDPAWGFIQKVQRKLGCPLY